MSVRVTVGFKMSVLVNTRGTAKTLIKASYRVRIQARGRVRVRVAVTGFGVRIVML